MVKALTILEEELPNYITEVKNKHSENAKAVAFTSFIQKVYNIESRDLDFEVPIKTTVLEMRGRIDAVFGNLIIEFKKDLRLSEEEAKEELLKYFQAYRERFPDSKYLGVANDGIHFKVFHPIYKDAIVSGLEEIDYLDIEENKAEDIFLWFDSYFFSTEKIIPTSKDLKKRFGLESPTFATIKRQLQDLFEKVKDYKPVKVKYDGWSKYLEIVYGDKPNELALFFKHTYLSTFVKLLVHVKLSKGRIERFDEIVPILYGDAFRKHGILNFMEEDFFTWIMFIAIKKSSSKIFQNLLHELYVYDLEKIDEDVLKELYQELVDPDIRKLLGEFYTPDWLAEKIIDTILQNDPTKSMMDPSCGSGTFLFKSIRYKIEKLQALGKDRAYILNHVLENVIGFDVHPLAAIIAKTNYLLALKDLLDSRTGPISIPVFLSDSLKTPTKKIDVSTTLTSFEFEALDKKFVFPVTIASNLSKMDDVIEKMRNHGREFEAIIENLKSSPSKSNLDSVYQNLVSSFEKSLFNIKDENEKRILIENIKVLFNLIKSESNSIWTYILRNMYKPIAISYRKVDVLVGNPPWLALQAMKNPVYQEYLKQRSLYYNIADSKKVHNIPNLELATLFFCQCADQYLNQNGLIAFVMPRSVLIGSQHENFLKFRKPPTKLSLIFDLEHVEPLFRVPSCVLFAMVNGETNYPVPKLNFSGSLSTSNSQLVDALKSLKIAEVKYSPAIRSTDNSFYHAKFSKGADIIPRCFWFVSIKSDSFLGFNPASPYIESDENKYAKAPWDKIKLSGNVEREFLYNSILSTDMIPFGYLKRRLVFLPVFVRNSTVELVKDSEQLGLQYPNTSKYLKDVENYWVNNNKGNPLTAYEWLNYRNKLTAQNPLPKFKVLYAASATYLTSCVINPNQKYTFEIDGSRFETQGFFADSTILYYDTESEEEAHYLCSILNSNYLDNLIKPLQAAGSFGPRHIMKLPLTFPIPKFDPKNTSHIELAKLSKNCHEIVSKSIPSIKLKSTGKIRATIRKEIEDEFNRISDITKKIMLEIASPTPKYLN